MVDLFGQELNHLVGAEILFNACQTVVFLTICVTKDMEVLYSFLWHAQSKASEDGL